jgi:endonuclease/exonuclease/phosphatase family metal-dependent hydrolase
LAAIAAWFAPGCDRPHQPAADPQAQAAAATPDAPPPANQHPATANQLRFVAYNLENWLTMDRMVNGRLEKSNPKPEPEKQAAVRIIASARPDLVGVCEIGTRDDLADLQQRLARAGLDLPHLHHAGGTDQTRHLGLLSRLPIQATAQPADSDYVLDGRTFQIQRGVLDATIDAGGTPVRFVGVHFKSKREVEEADQELMRRNEAELVRQHVESILTADPAARLAVYGDFNDTKRSRPLRAVQGPYNSPQFLTALRLGDDRGQVWTHHWDYEDVYSRFDWVLVSRELLKQVDNKASGIIDSPEWYRASDHRPLLVVFR